LKKKIAILSALFVLEILGLLKAEYKFFTPPGSYAVEVSLENSPYPRLPAYRNAITSLAVVGDWVVGGTSAEKGLTPFLFAVSLSDRRMAFSVDLKELVAGQRAVRSGFGSGADGVLYGGTIPDSAGGDGHLLEIVVEGRALAVRDLGVPVRGQGIFALTADPGRGRLYGITYPSGHFFAHDLRTSETALLSDTVPGKRDLVFLQSYVLEPADYLCRRLILDRRGRVFGSMPINRLFRYDPDTGRVSVLEAELPEGWGRRALGRVDAWTIAPDGVLYGGCAADGQLFRLDPDTGRVSNLGKPAQMPGMKGLAFAADGRIYGVTGGAPGYSHLFCYDPATQDFTDLGNPRFEMKAPGIEQGIWWRGFQIGTLAATPDGRQIVMGEEESLSQLLVFPVGPRP
jgi:hypothetical protein